MDFATAHNSIGKQVQAFDTQGKPTEIVKLESVHFGNRAMADVRNLRGERYKISIARIQPLKDESPAEEPKLAPVATLSPEMQARLNAAVADECARRSRLVEVCRRRHDKAREEVATFSGRLAALTESKDGDPLQVLSWAGEAFKAAARVRVYGRLLRTMTSLDSAATLESLTEYIDDQVMARAGRRNASTSVCDNLAEDEERCVWVDAREEFHREREAQLKDMRKQALEHEYNRGLKDAAAAQSGSETV